MVLACTTGTDMPSMWVLQADLTAMRKSLGATVDYFEADLTAFTTTRGLRQAVHSAPGNGSGVAARPAWAMPVSSDADASSIQTTELKSQELLEIKAVEIPAEKIATSSVGSFPGLTASTTQPVSSTPRTDVNGTVDIVTTIAPIDDARQLNSTNISTSSGDDQLMAGHIPELDGEQWLT